MIKPIADATDSLVQRISDVEKATYMALQVESSVTTLHSAALWLSLQENAQDKADAKSCTKAEELLRPLEEPGKLFPIQLERFVEAWLNRILSLETRLKSLREIEASRKWIVKIFDKALVPRVPLLGRYSAVVNIQVGTSAAMLEFVDWALHETETLGVESSAILYTLVQAKELVGPILRRKQDAVWTLNRELLLYLEPPNTPLLTWMRVVTKYFDPYHSSRQAKLKDIGIVLDQLELAEGTITDMVSTMFDTHHRLRLYREDLEKTYEAKLANTNNDQRTLYALQIPRVLDTETLKDILRTIKSTKEPLQQWRDRYWAYQKQHSEKLLQGAKDFRRDQRARRHRHRGT